MLPFLFPQQERFVGPRESENRNQTEQYEDRIDDVLMSTMDPPSENEDSEEERD